MSWFKTGCRMYSILFCFLQTYLLLFPMFMLAWSSGTYECMLRINIYGEAYSEIIFWVVSFPFVAYGVYLNLYGALRE